MSVHMGIYVAIGYTSIKKEDKVVYLDKLKLVLGKTEEQKYELQTYSKACNKAICSSKIKYWKVFYIKLY